MQVSFASTSTLPSPTAADLHSLLAEFAGQWPEAVARALVSLAPTRHVVELGSGSRLYTYCTLDTLLIPRLLSEDARLSSLPPLTTPDVQALTYAIEKGQLHAPAQWRLSFPPVQKETKAEAFKGSFCPYTNAFASIKAYMQWAAGEPAATTPLTFAEADALVRQYAADVRAAAPLACGCGCGI